VKAMDSSRSCPLRRLSKMAWGSIKVDGWQTGLKLHYQPDFMFWCPDDKVKSRHKSDPQAGP
jgi:hypothetical protein